MIYFFLISVGLLLLALGANLFVKRAPKTMAVVLAACAVLTLVSLAGLLFERLSGGRAEFVHPWAILL